MGFLSLHRMFLDFKSPGIRNQRSSANAWLGSWMGLALIAGLTGASTFVLMLCPCDRPAGSVNAIVLVSLASLFALLAVSVLYLRLRKDAAATAFISAFEAAALVALAVYAEMWAAFRVIQWLALHRR
ncbi:MAG TPA: hypothetical protein VMT38_01920 [Terracidiphilus sp.]|nr:hypothetical protein [Terracidiphilus sp.]